MNNEPTFHDPDEPRGDADLIFQQSCRAAALRLHDRGMPSEGGMLMLAAARLNELCSERDIRRDMRTIVNAAEPDGSAPRAPSKPRKPSSGPRHKFVNGVCVSDHGSGPCGAPKQRGGRPAKSAASAETAPPLDTRPEPLPGVTIARTMGNTAADKYADGGQGSSSMRRA